MKKLRKNSGFTLVEMLIVVAIIAILVAVSIPLVTSSLDKAKTQTDAANLRAAKAAGSIAYLSGYKVDDTHEIKTGDDFVFYYNAGNGVLAMDGDQIGQSDDVAKSKIYVQCKGGTIIADFADKLVDKTITPGVGENGSIDDDD